MSDKYTLGEAAAVGGIGAVAIAVLGALSGLFATTYHAQSGWQEAQTSYAHYPPKPATYFSNLIAGPTQQLRWSPGWSGADCERVG